MLNLRVYAFLLEVICFIVILLSGLLGCEFHEGTDLILFYGRVSAPRIGHGIYSRCSINMMGGWMDKHVKVCM